MCVIIITYWDREEYSLNKAEIVDKISKDINLTKKEISLIVDSLLKKMKTCIFNDERIELRSFGTFGTKVRKPRLARNPKTNQELFVPEHKIVYFKPGKELKDKVKYANYENDNKK
jgi:nucleoid DNA-binding protein